ncbi:hypothetical protein BTJ39_16880 [Izhakiella australiensis]|uniref:Flagellar hook-associated protein n=1 Tax=Izhakiella australiensis TaxID=1926881 RepID=A0A1S8YJ74_9GAMM|nr:hypothetical protein [Izhakiella australiensis]OON38763.1 hypothetical protein BTJ39_16880 [Izhakiella australiensis]
MQIDNRHVSPRAGAPLNQTKAAEQAAKVQSISHEKHRQDSAFPDSPRISSRPLRYGTQLNQQLTRVQQADDYLKAVESRVVAIQHALSQRKTSVVIADKMRQLQNLLTEREMKSGGSIDRQLKVNFEQNPRVNFRLPDGDVLVNNPQREMLTFSLAGNSREISAVELPAGGTSQQVVRLLNRTLGKWGIAAGTSSMGAVQFQVDETKWLRISQQLSIQGGGGLYPAEQFSPVKPRPEPSLEELLQQPLSAKRMLPVMKKTLSMLSVQRQVLQESQRKVKTRIESMATFNPQLSALSSAKRLAGWLRDADFPALNQALLAQARVPAARVRNVLSRGG